MLRVDVPVFLIEKAREPLEPTMTFPKLALAGETEICGWTPVPLTEIVAGELVALLTMLRLPAALPAEAGAKFTVRGMVWPAATVTVPEQPLNEKPVPLMA